MSDPVNFTPGNAIRQLGALVAVRAGYSFRGQISESPRGNVIAVQLRDFQGTQVPDWSGAARTSLERTPSDREWLRSGDILFVFRGSKFRALFLDQVPGPAVASTQFMLLRVRDHQQLLPAFLAWQLNQPPVQAQLDQSAAGTAQRSLRRGALEAVRIAVPSHELQRSTVELVRLASRERQALEELIRIREQQLNQIAYSLHPSQLAVQRP
jgi:hypothetical protein